MALAKYAEDIQEAIYERMAMREREYMYRFGASKTDTTQKGGEADVDDFTVRTHSNEQNGKDVLYDR